MEESRLERWELIVPLTPHRGGHYERMVAMFKRPLRQALGFQKKVTYRCMEAAVIRIEAIINNRPITAKSDDPKELQPLTPNHLIYGEVMVPNDWRLIKDSDLRAAYRKKMEMCNQFWQEFLQEVIKSNLPITKWKDRNYEGLENLY